MRSLFLACSLLGLSLACFAQATSSIAGTVFDPFGKPFGGATVQAKNTSGGALFKGESAKDGKYTIANVPAGTYDVTANVPALKGYEKKGVIVGATAASLDVKLEETTQLGTLGEDFVGAIEDRKRHQPPSGPTPRTADGKPDLSGVWWTPAITDNGKAEWLASAEAIAKDRRDNNSKESPQAHCLPSPVTRLGPLYEFVQSKQYLVIINDDESPGFHQVYLDGRDHPKELDFDLWYGHNIAHWEDDTLVIDRKGFNERAWVDQAAHPHSDQLHVIERYRRPDLGHLESTVIVEDPGVLAKPWTMKRVSDLAAKESIREFICAENNRDVEHMVGK